MNMMKARAEIMPISPMGIDGVAILKHIERCGRVCYQSSHRVTDDSWKRFAEMILKNGHESVLEHYSISVRFIVDRGVTHEIVRHRLASYSQESTRYCNYGDDDNISVIRPFYLDNMDPCIEEIWRKGMIAAEDAYLEMLLAGATPQEARANLPQSTKAELIMTANLREWRHFFKLRTAKAAHPQMREVAIPLLADFRYNIPVIFEDITPDGYKAVTYEGMEGAFHGTFLKFEKI